MAGKLMLSNYLLHIQSLIDGTFSFISYLSSLNMNIYRKRMDDHLYSISVTRVVFSYQYFKLLSLWPVLSWELSQDY